MRLKIEKILFYLFLILIPFQIRIFLHNVGSEWNSVFLYLGDLVLGVVLILWLIRTNKKEIFNKSNLLLFIFLIVAFISIFVSSHYKISAFRFLKLLEFVLVFLYAATIYKPNKILEVLFYSGFAQAILAIVQFIKQGSIGIKFIEAGVYSPNLAGVANFVSNGEKILRAYGSFLHPNVLAAFLLMAIFCFYTLWLTKPIGPTGLIEFIGLVFGLSLTFSRTAIMVFLLMSLGFFLIRFFKLRTLPHTPERLKDGKNLILLCGLVVISCILAIIILRPYLQARFLKFSLTDQALDLRFFYNKIALSMIKEKPILGIGIGNFVNSSHNYQAFLRAAAKAAQADEAGIPEWIYQPAHNIFLLIGAEIGIFGLIIFAIFIIKILIRIIRHLGIVNPASLIFITFLIIGLADHYFWTLQSGGIMFWLALALAKNE